MGYLPTKATLSPNRRRLVETMQALNFGRIEQLQIRAGESVFDTAPRQIEDVKIGAPENGPRPELDREDFALRSSVIELFRHLDRLGDGTVGIEVRHQKSARVVRTFQTLPPQATIYPAFFAAGGVDEIKADHVFEHAVNYAVIMRDAYVATTFAFRGQQPLRSRANHPYRDWQAGHEDIMCGYDFVWTYKAPDLLRRYLDARAHRVAATDESVLWDYRDTKCGNGPL